MIPTTGLIGMYVITRMVSLVMRTGDREEAVPVKLLAVLTILIAGWGMVSMLATGAAMSRVLP